MKSFILTGAPGAGKTAILRQLELDGFGVVEEAATDVIALRQAQGIGQPWTDPAFIPAVVGLQRLRQIRSASEAPEIQFHDRSVVCTAALAAYLGYPPCETLSRELERIQAEKIYCSEVFFIRNLGFIKPTEARRISFEESLRFERIHEETYRTHGFQIISIEPASLLERVDAIKLALKQIIQTSKPASARSKRRGAQEPTPQRPRTPPAR
jgi:predicted ATPase